LPPEPTVGSGLGFRVGRAVGSEAVAGVGSLVGVTEATALGTAAVVATSEVAQGRAPAIRTAETATRTSARTEDANTDGFTFLTRWACRAMDGRLRRAVEHEFRILTGTVPASQEVWEPESRCHHARSSRAPR
jgi:hypothetical protein